jgi:hypothetical protein
MICSGTGFGTREFEEDIVNHPPHYMVAGTEAINIIADVTEGLSGLECVCVANALKYLLRCNKKDKKDQDIRKAIKYLDMWEDSKDAKV